jgi:hypothetical protein
VVFAAPAITALRLSRSLCRPHLALLFVQMAVSNPQVGFAGRGKEITDLRP